MQAPHESIRFLVPPLSGLTSIAVQLVVGGQPSNTFIIAVDPPVINNVNIYDVTALVCWVLGGCVMPLSWSVLIRYVVLNITGAC